MSREFLTVADLKRRPRPRDFVERLLYEGCMSVWAGAPKSGKSFLLLDLAHAVACGRRWAGRDVDKGKVLIIPLEGVGLLYDRVRAWELEHGAKSPLIFSPDPLNLLTDDDAISDIIDFVREENVRLVILDTLARATAGAKESSFEDMSAAIAALDRIKDESGAHIAVVHHSGYSRAGPRGSSDIVAAPDLIVQIEREKGSPQRTARISENRHGKDGEVLRFTLEARTLDFSDARGKPVSSSIVQLAGEWFEDHGAEAEGEKPAPGGVDALALDTLAKLKNRNARTQIPLTASAYRKALRRDEWRADLKPASWARAFRRLMEKLEGTGQWDATTH